MREEDTPDGKLRHFTAEELADAFDRGEVAIIDVRTPSEYGFEQIDGALLSPLHAFRPEAIPRSPDKPVVFLCGSGVRSRKAAEAALAAGWLEAAHLEGGFRAWKEARLPTIAIDTATGAPRRMDPRAGRP